MVGDCLIILSRGNILKEDREMLKDALYEMIKAYQRQNKEIPVGGGLLEQLSIET